jgi:hypothetical protein
MFAGYSARARDAALRGRRCQLLEDDLRISDAGRSCMIADCLRSQRIDVIVYWAPGARPR